MVKYIKQNKKNEKLNKTKYNFSFTATSNMSSPYLTPKRPRPSDLVCPPAPKRMRLSAPSELLIPIGVQMVIEQLVPHELHDAVSREIKRIPKPSDDNPQIVRHVFWMPDHPDSVTSLKMILEMLCPTVRFVRADAGGDSAGRSLLAITFIWQKGTMSCV